MWSPDYEFEDFFGINEEYSNISNVKQVTDSTPQTYEEPGFSIVDDQTRYTLTNLISNENLEINAESPANSMAVITCSKTPSSEHQISFNVLEQREIHTVNIGSNYEAITPKFSILESSIETGTFNVVIL